MTLKRSVGRLAAVLVAFMLIVAACGGDDSGDDSAASDDTSDSDVATTAGGDFVDLGTFVGDPPEHIDPALNVTLDAYQVVNALYDGLTDIDATDPDNPVIVPARRRVLRGQRGRHGVDVHHPRGRAVLLDRRAGPAQLVRAGVGAGGASRTSPVTTAT